MSTASKVAEHKAKHPERYCPKERCLWHTGDGSYCPRHKGEPNGIRNQTQGNKLHSPTVD
jgi:hypothetical protein